MMVIRPPPGVKLYAITRISSLPIRHAAHRHPAAPHSLGGFFEEFALYCPGRSAYLPGVFGSHVANVLRRLKRVFVNSTERNRHSSYPRRPSRTPWCWLKHWLSSLLRHYRDGSYQPERYYFFLNPPIVNEELGLRRGLIDQSVEVEKRALDSNIQSLVFARSRKTVELTLRNLNERYLPIERPEMQGYRSGYLPRERRAIENGLREGRIKAVISTNAMN